jgi:hypothetical protein
LPTNQSPNYAQPITVDHTLTLRYLAIDPAGNRSEGQEIYTLIQPRQPVVGAVTFLDQTIQPPGTVRVKLEGPKQFEETIIRRRLEGGDEVVGARGARSWSLVTTAVTNDQLMTIAPKNVETLLATVGAVESSLTEVRFTPTTELSDPLASPPAGQYPLPIQVTLSAETVTTVQATVNRVVAASRAYHDSSAPVYYTTDGSVPTPGSPRYSTPIPLRQRTMLKFLAERPDGSLTLPVKAQYSFTSALLLTASIPGGTYPTQQVVTLTASDPSAVIYYTFDGDLSLTRQRYTAPLTINLHRTLTAYAVAADGMESPVITELYRIVPAGYSGSPTGCGLYRKCPLRR